MARRKLEGFGDNGDTGDTGGASGSMILRLSPFLSPISCSPGLSLMILTDQPAWKYRIRNNNNNNIPGLRSLDPGNPWIDFRLRII